MENTTGSLPAGGVPGISVLMPCYNASRWLPEAIESILAQTCTDFELLIIDDGSTDASPGIINRYAGSDKRIVVLTKPNTGLAHSLNLGLEKARGKWIARMDSDDISEPVRLEEQLRLVKAAPGAVLAGSGFLEIDAAGRVIKKNIYPVSHNALSRNLERLLRFFPHSSAFYLAEAARRVKGYNPRIRRAEDWKLWLDLSSAGRLACHPECLVRVRKHPAQISLDSGGARQFYDTMAATVCHFLKKTGSGDPSVSGSPEEWEIFLKWIEDRVDESGTLLRQKAWTDARNAWFASAEKPARMMQLMRGVLDSGSPGLLLREKLFGSSLPARFAAKWLHRAG